MRPYSTVSDQSACWPAAVAGLKISLKSADSLNGLEIPMEGKSIPELAKKLLLKLSTVVFQ